MTKIEKELREEIAKLREHIAVLEARPQYPPIVNPIYPEPVCPRRPQIWYSSNSFARFQPNLHNMLKPPTRAARAYGLLCQRDKQLIQGVKIEFTTVEPGNPFSYKDADNIPDTAIRAGVDVSGMKSTNTKGQIK